MNIDDIASLNLHDSELISVLVMTTDEGDENISLRLNYLIDYESFESVPKALIFEGCWSSTLKMNFRVQRPDSILSAEEMIDSDFINEIRNRWSSIGFPQTTILRHFVITTSLSGSRLDIVAEKLRLCDMVPND